MNNPVTFSGELKNVLDDLGKRMGVLIDWTKDNVVPQVTDLLHRITLYEIYTSIAWIVIAVIGFIFGCILFSKDEKWGMQDLGKIFGSFLIIIGGLIITFQTFDIIRACTLPETVWIEYIKNYMSSLK